ncbi:MAG: hypothetical protein E6K52_15250 [Gammaproteobacteria bacterium]|nr:MAG: hypothetical protein E6K52_15250 [Gammaproteobacteria bacterium]
MNDNHVIRTASAPAGLETLTRETPRKHFEAWLSGARATSSQSDPAGALAGDRRPYPVFIVATAGGGIRAAYWTALVLGTAADRVGASAWRRHLYALSGVSGGSLGAAVHVVELATEGSPTNLAQRAEGMLAQDHLSPVTAFMLYPDLLQRFLPFPVAAFDRARALEMSWEKSGHDVLGVEAFSEPFGTLWSGRYHSMPALLLNSTRVETGQRAIVSSLELSNDFLDAVDLLQRPANGRPDGSGYPLRSFDTLRLSTAVHLSARFTYVSPAARVENAQGKLWGRLVDGGYFENSGTATATDLVRALNLDWDSIQDASDESRDPAFVPPAVPIVLLIKNDPHGPSICSAHVDPKESQSQLLTEVKSPVDALLATREARGRLSEREIIRTVDGPGALPADCDRGCILEFSLAHTPTTRGESQPTATQQAFTDPPLGWSLSETSRAAIKSRIGDHEREFRCIDDLIKTGQCASPTTCEP